MPALNFTSSPSETTPSSDPIRATWTSSGLLVVIAILIVTALSIISFLIYYHLRRPSRISPTFLTGILGWINRGDSDIEKCTRTNIIGKEMISGPELLYGTGSLVLNDSYISPSDMVSSISSIHFISVWHSLIDYLGYNWYNVQESRDCYSEPTKSTKCQKANVEERLESTSNSMYTFTIRLNTEVWCHSSLG